jgi:hypothetical protein
MSRRNGVRFLGLALLGFGLLMVAWMFFGGAVDRCLDAGGAWDYDDERCVFARDGAADDALKAVDGEASE